MVSNDNNETVTAVEILADEEQRKNTEKRRQAWWYMAERSKEMLRLKWKRVELSLVGVVDTTLSDDVGRFALGHVYHRQQERRGKERGRLTRRVLQLGNSLVTTTFSQQDSGVRSMSQDVTTNRFSAISASEECTRSRITLNLVGHEDSNVELLSDVVESRQELSKLLLPLRKLSSSSVVDSETCHDTVDDQESEVAGHELFRELFEKIELMFAVVATSVCDVLKRGVGVQTEAFCDLSDTLRAERAFCVNIGRLAFSTTHVLQMSEMSKWNDERVVPLVAVQSHTWCGKAESFHILLESV